VVLLLLHYCHADYDCLLVDLLVSAGATTEGGEVAGGAADARFLVVVSVVAPLFGLDSREGAEETRISSSTDSLLDLRLEDSRRGVAVAITSSWGSGSSTTASPLDFRFDNSRSGWDGGREACRCIVFQNFELLRFINVLYDDNLLWLGFQLRIRYRSVSR
jgi:hypothetical protein